MIFSRLRGILYPNRRENHSCGGSALEKLMHKLKILGEAARYDASCASSGSGRQGRPGGLGNAHMAGICHSWSEDGRCVSLLKILMSNACVYDCAYCVNRRSSSVPRATFTPEEIARLTVEFYRRNYIEGLFLSSGVIKNAQYTMELLIRAVSLLRNQYGFCGYIHVKVIPGADPALVTRLGFLADRISVNIELPTSQSLRLLAPQKPAEAILNPMAHIRDCKLQNAEERLVCRHAPLFAPGGQSTQLIVGATPERDRDILRLSSRLYKRYHLKRVYFSAYIPVSEHPLLPGLGTRAPLLREHRLYQADWLMRFYQFDVDEIVDDGSPDLDTDVDPKCAWALRHPELFPVEINRADYELLLRVPGIGVKSAQRIVAARRGRWLSYDELRRLGVVLKRAQYFITAKGKFFGGIEPGHPMLRQLLSEGGQYEQLTLFDAPPAPALAGAVPGLALPAQGFKQ